MTAETAETRPPVEAAAESAASVQPGGCVHPAGQENRRTYHLVRVVSVDVTLPDQYPVVTLEDAERAGDPEPVGDAQHVGEAGGHRGRLSFRIGTAEGVALAHALAGTVPPRPLTHDLFAGVLERCGVDILAVRLTGRVGPTYLAELELAGPSGREVLSCRPSDGICLALRQRVVAPVLCDERLFSTAGDVAPDLPAPGDGPA